MTNDDMSEKESIDTPHRIFLDNYTFIGRDGEGYYHHQDDTIPAVIVCDDRGHRTGRHDWWLEFDGEINHVEPGLKYAADLEKWADFVAEKRGWHDRALFTAPDMRQAFMEGGR